MSAARTQGVPTVKIDNDQVRVTRWDFAPGAETGHHRHEHDYIVVPISTGDLLIVDKDGNDSISQLTVGEPYFREAGVEHNVINQNSTEFSFIEIELL